MQNHVIRNRSVLTGKGDQNAREHVVYMIERVLAEMNAQTRIKNLMRLEGNTLHVGNRQWNLSEKRHIYLFGAGKAVNAMAMAVCEILGERITHGIISVKIKEPTDKYINTDVYVGGHPLPNEEGLAAAKAIIKMIDQASKDDLFISVFSGGSSALLTYPVEGITLADEIIAQDQLLKSGAKILEINAVRRHISQTNGGWLAKRIQDKGAELISLMIGDCVGSGITKNRDEPTEFWGTLVAPDKTTIADARATIQNYALTDILPKRIMEYIMDDTRIRETPKNQFDRVTTFVLDNVPDSCEAAKKVAAEMGIPLMILTTFMEGESREVGICMASICREIQTNHRPMVPPCYVVFSGETTTTINKACKGKGGPSQELVLGFGIGVREFSNIAIASVDTEGTDGITLNAGGVADTFTCQRMDALKINPYTVLRDHDSGTALELLGDNIITGNTGTNVCDFNVIYIDA
jgi:glycerate 2-kinase